MICGSVLPQKCPTTAALFNFKNANRFNFKSGHLDIIHLTLNAPIATKVVCFSRLLKCLKSLYGKQCGPRSDCSYRSSLFWVHAVCFYTLFVGNVRQLFAADDFSRRHFQMHFFLGALRVKVSEVAFSTIKYFIYKYLIMHVHWYIFKDGVNFPIWRP